MSLIWQKIKTTLKVLTLTGVILGLLGLAGATYYVADTIKDTPTITPAMLDTPDSSNMYAANGELMWSSEENKRIKVTYEDLPQTYIDLLLATENKDFFDEYGVSPKGFVNAVVSYVQEKMGKGEARGGSTIEQQLIKLTVFSTHEEHRTIDRKIKEMFLAFQMNQNFSKEEILEFYINRLFLGEGSYGAQTIASTYYDKPLSELSTAQLALIAGLGQRPSDYNLYDNPDLAKERRDTILSIGLEDGILSQAEYNEAVEEPIDHGLKERYWRQTENLEQTSKYDYFVTAVFDQLNKEGYDPATTAMQIHTTLDVDAYNHINNVVENSPELFEADNTQVAVAVVHNKTGQVIAVNGGRHPTEPLGFNRAINQMRSTGSATKGLFYAIGMDYLNLGTDTTVSSAAYQYEGTDIIATDYGGVTGGDVTVQHALRQSLNTTTLRIFDQTGAWNNEKTLKKLGFDNLEHPMSPAQSLGLDASVIDVASALSALGNLGEYTPKTLIDHIVFADESVKSYIQEPTRVLKASSAFMTNHILAYNDRQGQMNQGAGMNGITQGTKTGTVAYPDEADVPYRSAMDMWVTGYTQDYSLALWLGYDDAYADDGYLSEDATNKVKLKLYKALAEPIFRKGSTDPWQKPDTVEHVSGRDINAHYRPLDDVVRTHVPELTPLENLYVDLFGRYLGPALDKEPYVAYQSEWQDIVPRSWEPGVALQKLTREQEEWVAKFQQETTRLKQSLERQLDRDYPRRHEYVPPQEEIPGVTTPSQPSHVLEDSVTPFTNPEEESSHHTFQNESQPPSFDEPSEFDDFWGDEPPLDEVSEESDDSLVTFE